MSARLESNRVHWVRASKCLCHAVDAQLVETASSYARMKFVHHVIKCKKAAGGICVPLLLFDRLIHTKVLCLLTYVRARSSFPSLGFAFHLVVLYLVPRHMAQCSMQRSGTLLQLGAYVLRHLLRSWRQSTQTEPIARADGR